MSEIMDFVFIMDDEQYKSFERFAEQVAEVVLLD